MPYKTKEARAINDAQRRNKNVEFLRRYKVEKGCVDCGWNEHHAGLQFDHLPGFVKTANVTSLLYRNRKIIELEIKKCEVRCSRCHSIMTFLRGTQSFALKKKRESELK